MEILNTINVQAEQLVQNVRRLFDSRLEMKGITLNRGRSKEMFESTSSFDTISLQNCKFEKMANEPYGW
jgi:hypothetical protein